MNKFKVGDRVIRTSSHSILVMGDIYVVDRVDYDSVGIKGHGRNYSVSFFKLAPTEREEVEKALNVMQKYNIIRNCDGYGNHIKFSVGGFNAKSRESMLDHMFPKKNKELEALKKKQGELAEAIEALEKSL